MFVGGLVAVTGGLLFARSQPAQFQTNARFVIAPAAGIQDGRDIVQTIDALANRRAIVSTFGQVVLSERSFQEAVRGAGLTPGQTERTKVSAVVLPEANVVEVFVRGPSKNLTETTLLLLGAEATRYFENLYKVYTIQTLEVARLKTEQVEPKPVQTAAIAGVLGTALAFLVGLGGERLRGGPAPSQEPRAAFPGDSSPEVEPAPGPDAGGRQVLPEYTGRPALGPHPDPLEIPPAGVDHTRPGQALMVRPGVDPYRHDHLPSPAVIDDPDWWLSELYELGREVRGWSPGVSAGGREADDARRWRSELDDLGRLLSAWDDGGTNRGRDDGHPDLPKPV